MSLLFDENMSRRLVVALSDLFLGAQHVCAIGLEQASDEAIWSHANATGLTIVTKDADFVQRLFLRGPPPQVVWLRVGVHTGKINERISSRQPVRRWR
ncbi:MAG: DUF5615 family PIN-like protein [Hyphomicrobiaceae bacterium]|nr:DUF5615 family PIN-like protein [Hyphomicrobiaceae bacterium]